MRGHPRYGWFSYYFNLLLLTSMDHRRRLQFIRRKARDAEASVNPDVRLRMLLHCTDWPIDLLDSSGADSDLCENRKEIEELQKEMVERYQNERLAQGRY